MPLVHYIFCNVLVVPQVRGTEWLHVVYEDGDEEDMSLEVRGLSASSTTISYVRARRLVTSVIASGNHRIVGNRRPNRMRACGDLQPSSAAVFWLCPSRRTRMRRSQHSGWGAGGTVLPTGVSSLGSRCRRAITVIIENLHRVHWLCAGIQLWTDDGWLPAGLVAECNWCMKYTSCWTQQSE